MGDKSYTRRWLLKCLAAAAALQVDTLSKLALGAGKGLNPGSATVEPRRVLHFVTRRLAFSDAERLLKLGRQAGFNTVIPAVAWRGSTALNSTPWVRMSRSTWSPSMLRELSDLARSLGFEVIPQLPLMSKADVLFQGNRPELLFNKSTYDPRKEDVYAAVFPIIDEIIELMEPKSLHIGHDEVWGWKKKDYQKGRLEADEVILPAELFAEDVLKIQKVTQVCLHETISSFNIT